MQESQQEQDPDNVEQEAPKAKSYWKRYAVIGGVLVAAAVIAVIIVFTTTGGDEEPTKGFALQQAFNEEFQPIPFSGTWGYNDQFLFSNGGDLLKFDPATNNTSLIMMAAVVDIRNVSGWAMSGDNQYLLIHNDLDSSDHNSHKSYYTIVDLDTFDSFFISANGLQAELQLAKWSNHGSSLVFVQNNILYYMESARSTPIRITEGQTNVSIGIPDWVYQEEVFSSQQAIWFSQNNAALAFVQFDDTNVRQIRYSKFGEPGTIGSQYTDDRKIFYPKAGTDNPRVQLVYLSLSGINSANLVLNTANAPQSVGEDHILTSVAWASSTKLVAMWTNRVQNLGVIQVCENSQCREIKSLSVANGWLEPSQQLFFDTENNQIATIQTDNSVNGFPQVVTISLVDGSTTQVTSGTTSVRKILKWDTAQNQILFLANSERDSQYTHLYAVRPNQEIQCLTCHIVIDGVQQTVFDAEINSDGSTLLLHIKGPSIPRVDLYSYNLTNAGVTIHQIRSMQTNEHIHKNLVDVTLPVITYHDVPLADSGYSARVKLMVRADADLGGSIKYPLIIQVNGGGPNSYLGTDEWKVDWDSYLVSNMSYVVAVIDARGSGRRGNRYTFAGYKHLGGIDVSDQLEVAKILSQTLNYVDADRIAIWGSRYGGYAAAMALAKDTNGVLKCAAAVGPVTDWFYYNSMYTERYMGLPTEQDNLAGYRASSLINQVNNLRNKTLYLVQGTIDEDVHYQHSMAFARQLELNDVPFTQMTYPDQQNDLKGVSLHLFHGLNRFVNDCLGVKSD